MTITEYILKEASKLTPIEKAQLIDKLISILDNLTERLTNCGQKRPRIGLMPMIKGESRQFL